MLITMKVEWLPQSGKVYVFSMSADTKIACHVLALPLGKLVREENKRFNLVLYQSLHKEGLIFFFYQL